jgi:hypothetical protein
MTGSKPDFLIVGAAKSGTTSLAINLNLHPGIYIPAGEVHYFTKHWDRGPQWYLSHFNQRGKVQGEKSPTYLYYLECHQRMQRFLPEAKLVVLLRDPVARAFSNWNMRYNDKRLIRQGLHYNSQREKQDHLKSLDFTAIVDYYLAREGKGSLFQRPLDIVHRGLYILQIQNLLKFYHREDLLILITELFSRDETKVYADVCRFLNVLPFEPESFEKYRVGDYKNTIPEEAAGKLREFYRPYNERLFRFLGYRVHQWEEKFGRAIETRE